MIPVDEDDYAQAVVWLHKALRPAIVLVNLHNRMFQEPGDPRIEVGFGGMVRYDDPDMDARMAMLLAMQQRLASDPRVQALLERLRGAGVDHRFAEVGGDYGGSGRALLLTAKRSDLRELEALAAADAGFATPAERAEAADKFRIYLARNYSPDWEANRTRYPDVGGSPYQPREEWSRTT
ncbi:MAG: hypothetical protein ACJ8D6_01035 [Sphingomicrobium sp.]